MSRQTVVIVAGIVTVAAIIAISQPNNPDTTVVEGKEIATADNYFWPEGAIIHKKLGNKWFCVEIDGNHLLVRKRGRSSFGVAIDSCLED